MRAQSCVVHRQQGWVAPRVPMSARDQLGTACWRLFFRSAWTHQLLSRQLSRQLGFGRIPGGPQPLTWLLGCCRLCPQRAPAPCFPCQIPGSLIWGGPELLCSALHLPSLAPAAQAGHEHLAHVRGDKTWVGTGCFGSHSNPKGVVWKGHGGKIALMCRRRQGVALREGCVVGVRGRDKCLYSCGQTCARSTLSLCHVSLTPV